MNWLLLIVVWTGSAMGASAPVVHQIEFASRDQCEQAAVSVKKGIYGPTLWVKATCMERSK